MERPPAKVLLPLVLVFALAALAVSFAAEEPASQAEPDAEVADAQGVLPPQIILGTQKAPRFPPAALAARFSGAVTVQVTVGADGKLEDVKAIECNHPNVGFEKAAVDAVEEWRFEPAMKGSEPVEYTTSFRLNFYSATRRGSYVTASGVPSLARDDRSTDEYRLSGVPRTLVTPGNTGRKR